MSGCVRVCERVVEESSKMHETRNGKKGGKKITCNLKTVCHVVGSSVGCWLLGLLLLLLRMNSGSTDALGSAAKKTGWGK